MRVVPRKLRLENFRAIQLGPRGTFIGIARKLSRLLSQCRGLGGSTLVQEWGVAMVLGSVQLWAVAMELGAVVQYYNILYSRA